MPRSTVSTAEERRRAWVQGRRPTFVQGPRHCTTTEERRRGFAARVLPLAHEGAAFGIEGKNQPRPHHWHDATFVSRRGPSYSTGIHYGGEWCQASGYRY